ncbi:MAG: SEC-C metal-binding domain-containing protein [Bryobacteraceae bacterium]
MRVHSVEKGEAIVALCNQHGWQVIVGIEEDKPEYTSDVDWLLDKLSGASMAVGKPRQPPRIGGNDYCPCRSGKKFKNCCGAASLTSPGNQGH